MRISSHFFWRTYTRESRLLWHSKSYSQLFCFITYEYLKKKNVTNYIFDFTQNETSFHWPPISRHYALLFFSISVIRNSSSVCGNANNLSNCSEAQRPIQRGRSYNRWFLFPGCLLCQVIDSCNRFIPHPLCVTIVRIYEPRSSFWLLNHR